MDSFTQIVLGAACGELVAGKKLGNRAMLWGAIGGTIPDLDVFFRFIFDDIYATKYHRHFTHSLFFAVIFPWFVGYLTLKYYEYRPKLKWAMMVVPILILTSVMFLLFNKIGTQSFIVWGINIGLLVGIYFVIKHYIKSDFKETSMAYKDWVKLFFWAIFTHPLLDCFTTYGTQLFQPFNDYRVNFNAISVVDPLYTVPFFILIVIAMFKDRLNPIRHKLIWGGIVISSLYLAFTVVNKFQVESYLSKRLTEQGIHFDRMSTTPTPLNNVLWNAMVETPEGYYLTEHSILSGTDAPLPYVHYIDKNHDLIEGLEDERIDILRWLSKGYFKIDKEGDNIYRWSDLRFGRIPAANYAHSDDYIFTYIIETLGKKVGKVYQRKSNPSESFDFPVFWERIKGQK